MKTKLGVLGVLGVLVVAVLTAGTFLSGPALDTNRPATGTVGSTALQEGAVRANHLGEPEDSLFGLLTFRFDDARRVLYDSVYYRVDNAVDGRGPFPWLKGSVMANRPETGHDCYYGGARQTNFGCSIAELRTMAAAGWEIGGHTKAHTLTQQNIMAGLAKANLAAIEHQVGDNYRYLADTLGFAVRGLAHPNNAYCRQYSDVVANYFDWATYVSGLSALDSIAANTFYDFDIGINNWYIGTTGDRTPYGLTYGAVVNRYNIPASKSYISGQTTAELRDWIRNVAEAKSWAVMLVHSPYSHYSGGSWLKGGDDADNYFDDFLVVVDSLVQANLLRVVTLSEGLERVQRRPSYKANLIWDFTDWDANGVPDGAVHTDAWDEGNCVLHASGGFWNKPYATVTFGTNPLRWYVVAHPPAGSILEFSCLIRGVTTTLTAAMNAGVWTTKPPATSITGLTHIGTGGSPTHVTNVGHWNVFTWRIDPHYEGEYINLYFLKSAGSGTTMDVCDPKLRIVGGRTSAISAGY